MNKAIIARLSIMNLLIFGMIGSWYFPLSTYMSLGLGLSDIIGLAYSLMGFAVIVSVLFVGAVADRYLSAEKLVSGLAILSAVSLWLLTFIGHSKSLFLTILFFHLLFFMPMLPLSAAIAFSSLKDGARQFPITRFWGSIGFLSAGLIVGSIEGAARTPFPMQMGALFGVALALYAWTLPSTPPRASEEPVNWKSLFGLDFVSQVKDRSFWIFITAAFAMFVPLSFYYAYSNVFFEEIGLQLTILGHVFEPTAIQMLGHSTELLFLLLLPMLLTRFGIKTIILVGMGTWAARFVMFAFGFSDAGLNMPLLLFGIFLHGVCQDFFAVASVIYIDACFRATARARAQAFLALVMTGLGPLVGANLAGYIFNLGAAGPGGHDWRFTWLAPAVMAAVVTVAFAFLFKERSRQPEAEAR